MIIVNLIKTERGKWNVSLGLWAVLALLQIQPLYAMEKKETPNEKIENLKREVKNGTSEEEINKLAGNIAQDVKNRADWHLDIYKEIVGFIGQVEKASLTTKGTLLDSINFFEKKMNADEIKKFKLTETDKEEVISLFQAWREKVNTATTELQFEDFKKSFFDRLNLDGFDEWHKKFGDINEKNLADFSGILNIFSLLTKENEVELEKEKKLKERLKKQKLMQRQLKVQQAEAERRMQLTGQMTASKVTNPETGKIIGVKK
jgi:hypothetical protein